MAHSIEGLIHRGGIARAEQQQGARGGTGAGQQFGFFVFCEVVLDGADRVDLAALAHPDEGQAACPSLLSLAEHIAAGLDAHVADGVVAAGHGDALHRAAGGHCAAEYLESHLGHQVGDIGELQAVAGVGAIGAVAGHGLVPGEAREGTGQLHPFHGLPDRGDQGLVELQDLLLVHEAHFDVQLGEFRLAIGPQIFVAEAAGHLVVALQAAHHQQLLKQLGRLGQGKPLPTAHPAGHQVVAGALGGGAGEHRGFHLDKARLFKEAAHRLHGAVAQAQVAVHALAAQVEVAVAQPQLFAGVLLVVHRHGEGQVALHGVEHGDGAGQHLDAAGGQSVVDGIGGSLPHLAGHLNHRFVAQVLSYGEHLGAIVGIDSDLHAAAAVAQVDKNHAAVVTTSVYPAAELHGLAAGVVTQVAASVAAHAEIRSEWAIVPPGGVSACRRDASPPALARPCRESAPPARCPAWRRWLVRRPGRSLLRGWVTSCRW